MKINRKLIAIGGVIISCLISLLNIDYSNIKEPWENINLISCVIFIILGVIFYQDYKNEKTLKK